MKKKNNFTTFHEVIKTTIPSPPYILHDCKIRRLIKKSKDLYIELEKGFYRFENEDFKLVEGNIRLEKVDFESSYVYILEMKKDKRVSTYKAKKYTLKDFIKKYKKIDFEILDETYSYNLTKVTGLVHEKNVGIEFSMEIYHLGKMVYLVEDSTLSSS